MAVQVHGTCYQLGFPAIPSFHSLLSTSSSLGYAHILRNVPGLPVGSPLPCHGPEFGSFMNMISVAVGFTK